MKNRKLVLIAAIAAIALMMVSAVQADPITAAKTTGSDSATPPVLVGPLAVGTKMFSDRGVTVKELPSLLAGSDFVQMMMGNKDNASFKLYLTLAVAADVYLLIDGRVGGPDTTDDLPVFTNKMKWVPAMGYERVEGVFVQHSGDGTKFAAYKKRFSAGTDILVGEEQNDGGGRGMYAVTAITADPKFNPAPTVNAGADQILLNPTFPLVLTMAATVSDKDPEDPSEPRGTLTMTWSQVSGPGTVTFSDVAIEDPTVSLPVAGDYVLKLYASDGTKSTEDTVAIYVNDVSKNMLMAHWNFESITTENKSVVDVAKGNNGLWAATEPNQVPTIVAGWITGSTQAVDFNKPAANPPVVKVPGYGWVNVTTADVDPNFIFGPRYAITISAWIKVAAFSGDWASVVGKGDSAWRLARNGSSNVMCMHLNGLTVKPGQTGSGIEGNGPKGTISVNDDKWHHVCSTYDGAKMCLYIDGYLDNSGLYTGLINTNTNNVGIAQNTGSAGRNWPGALDEIQVYNYALSETEVRAMTAQGKTKAIVKAGPDATFLKKPGLSYTLAGIVADYGAPDGLTVLWTQVSGPEGAEAVFANPSSPTSTVDLPKAGVYTLKLTAVDEVATVEDTVVITATTPSCADVVTAGLIQKTDLNKDCYVNIQDLAIMLLNWTKCNDPESLDVNCVWPF